MQPCPQGTCLMVVSQVSVLLGKSDLGRKKPLFWKASSPWPAPKNRPYHWGSYAVVDGPWKLISNTDLSHVELYAITKDQKESSDCSAEHPEVVNLLKGRIQEWQQTLPPEARRPGLFVRPWLDSFIFLIKR